MTSEGGTYHYGIVFSMDTNGTNYKVLLNFNINNGKWPEGSLALVNNRLYGMTPDGGPANDSTGLIFSIDTDGTGYMLLHDFYYYTDGAYPSGYLTFSGSTCYGMTAYGGMIGSHIYRAGTIFKYEDITSSINELQTQNYRLEVYPNPNNGRFTISITNYELLPIAIGSTNYIEIYNMLGEKIYSQSLNILPDSYRDSKLGIDLSGQPAGIYLYRVITQTGNLIGQGKFIIQ